MLVLHNSLAPNVRQSCRVCTGDGHRNGAEVAGRFVQVQPVALEQQVHVGLTEIVRSVPEVEGAVGNPVKEQGPNISVTQQGICDERIEAERVNAGLTCSARGRDTFQRLLPLDTLCQSVSPVRPLL